MKRRLIFSLFVSCVFFVEAMEVGMKEEEVQNKPLRLNNEQASNGFSSLVSMRLTKKERKDAVPFNESMFKKIKQRDYQSALNEVRKQGQDDDLLKKQFFSWYDSSKDITFVRFCFDNNSEKVTNIDFLGCYGCIIDLFMKYVISGENDKLEQFKGFMKHIKGKRSSKRKSSIENNKMIDELKKIVSDNRLFNAILHTNYSYFESEHTKSNFMQLFHGDYAHIIERVVKFFDNSMLSQFQLLGLRSFLLISSASKLLTKNRARYFVDSDKITIEQPCFVYRNYPVNRAIYYAITLELFVRYLIFGNHNDIQKLEQVMRIKGNLSFSINKLREIVNNDTLFRDMMRSNVRFFHNKPKRQKEMINCSQRDYSIYELIKMFSKFF